MDIQPRRPQRGTNNRDISGNEARPRPLMNDFAPRRPLQSAPQPRPFQPASPTPPATQTVPAPARPQPSVAPQAPQPTPPENNLPFEPPVPTKLDEPREPKRRSSSGHAGLMGLLIFVILGALLLSPLLPGKVINNFPGSSASSSNGDQSFACMNDIQNTSSTTTYTTKLGSPLVYKSATSTTLRGTCDGKSQTVIGGTTTQFSPLAALVNVLLAAVVAIIVAKLWRKIFGSRD